ncbi:hypothetical protein DY000_02057043 [Brassica cretica]|uniref:Uncharacterized protein n=1 Tax=Brassica cretica TaxID=69181 RepID=A0ABQ7A911_BRACR|nr:hypothetical protein DY000_02057043 [Brassica cretica]
MVIVFVEAKDGRRSPDLARSGGSLLWLSSSTRWCWSPGDSMKKVKKIVEVFVLRPKIAASVETTANRRNARDMSSREAFCDTGMRSTQLSRLSLLSGFLSVISSPSSSPPSSDKETSLVVVKTHNNSNNPSESSDDGSSLKMKMITFSDESNTSFVLEKPFVVEDNKLETSLSEGCFIKEHVNEEMLVYEFMSCGVLKGLFAHDRSFAINIQLIIGAAYNPFGVDVFVSERKINHIAQYVKLPVTTASAKLPSLLVVNVQVASYEFTTLTCIPNVITYRGAKIQAKYLLPYLLGQSVVCGERCMICLLLIVLKLSPRKMKYLALYMTCTESF